MAEKELIKKHVLILGDTISDDYDKETLITLFAEEGIDLDLRIVKDASIAKAVIETLKDKDIKPDIVSVDYENEEGITFAKNVLEAQEMLPEKLFIHSALGRNMTAPKLRKWHNDTRERLELTAIGADDVESLLAPFSHKYDKGSRDILTYMNAAWGIHIPLSKQEALERNNTISGMLPVDTFLEQWNGKLKDYGRDILELLDTNDIKNLYSSATLENETDLKKISDIAASSLPNTINGFIAYNVEEAQQLAAENKTVILAVNLDELREYLPVMGKISAMIFTSYSYAHIKDAAEVNGVTTYICSGGMSEEEDIQKIAEIQQALPFGSEVCINENGIYKGKGILGEQKNQDDKGMLRIEVSSVIGDTQFNYQENSLNVHINAETAEQVRVAIAQDAGVDGVGLVRTENLLPQDDTLTLLQEYLLTESNEQKQAILDTFEERYTDAFHSLFEKVEYFGLSPINIRLLDTKIEEVFPKGESRDKLTATLGKSPDALAARIDALETNDEIGAGFALKHPEFYAMQARAAFAAQKDTEHMHAPSIMIPLVRSADELATIKETIHAVAKEFREELNYKFGAMIENKEAAADIANIAKITKFLSFGTSDFTASVLGIDRYDGEKSADWSKENNYARNPFISLAPDVADVMTKATKEARGANKYIEIGMCGAQASDKASIEIAREVGLDSISVNASPQTLLTTAALEAQGRIAHAKMLENGPSSEVDGGETLHGKESGRSFP